MMDSDTQMRHATLFFCVLLLRVHRLHGAYCICSTVHKLMCGTEGKYLCGFLHPLTEITRAHAHVLYTELRHNEQNDKSAEMWGKAMCAFF